MEEGGRSQNQSEEDVSMENRHRDAKLLSLKMERGGLETRNVATCEPGKGKQMDSLLGPPERTQPCQHVDFSPARLMSDF